LKDKDYLWIIGGGEMQVPSVLEAKKLGLGVIVSDMNASCICEPIADVFLKLDIFDIEGHIEQANKLIKAGLKIVGVFAAGIDAPETMAVLAKDLGLHAVEPNIARLVHHKANFRSAMERIGIPVPKFVVINEDNIGKITEIADKVGYPLIIKNTDSSGSRGTRILYEPDNEVLTNTAKIAIAVSKSAQALMESFWDGPEQTVETLFDIDGVFHPCFITDRHFDKSEGYALETELRHPSVLPQDTQNEMYALAKEVAEAIGVKVGAAKYDMILTKDGPRIIEMTVRLSGGFDCQYLVPAATGKNILKAGILTAIGKKFHPSLLQDQLGKISLSRSLWPKPGRIVDIRNLEEARKIPGVEKIVMRLKVGDIVDQYVDCTKRVCFIIVSGRTYEEADAIYKNVENLLIIETAPSHD
jgi:biotin carboxylase